MNSGGILVYSRVVRKELDRLSYLSTRISELESLKRALESYPTANQEEKHFVDSASDIISSFKERTVMDPNFYLIGTSVMRDVTDGRTVSIVFEYILKGESDLRLNVISLGDHNSDNVELLFNSFRSLVPETNGKSAEAVNKYLKASRAAAAERMRFIK